MGNSGSDIVIRQFRQTVSEVFSQELANSGLDDLSEEQILGKAKSNTPAFPAIIQVGPTTVCNLRCPECYHRIFRSNPSYRPIHININLFKRIIQEIKSFPPQTILRFLGRGEPLLHPDIFEIIGYAKAWLPGPVSLITNGHLLSRKVAEQLLATEIDVVDISVDAVTPETYKLVRGYGFIELEEKIRQLVKLKNDGNKKTKIMVSFLLQIENYMEAIAFREKWAGIVDKVIFRKYHSYVGKVTEKPGMEQTRYPCVALWTRVNINESGKITLCYVDWDETHVLADLNEKDVTILKTWGAAYGIPRICHINGTYPDLCSKCKTGWEAAHWVLSYEQAINQVHGKQHT